MQNLGLTLALDAEKGICSPKYATRLIEFYRSRGCVFTRHGVFVEVSPDPVDDDERTNHHAD